MIANLHKLYNHRNVGIKSEEQTAQEININQNVQVKIYRFFDDDGLMAEVMDWGSFGSLANFNAILYTFASYPGVTEIKVLIDGAEDIEGSHFSFKGVFPAERYLQ